MLLRIFLGIGRAWEDVKRETTNVLQPVEKLVNRNKKEILKVLGVLEAAAQAKKLNDLENSLPKQTDNKNEI
jgi:hypothetical protein